MKERFRPQPENPKQHAPEAGAGPLGLPPPPDTEQTAQGGGSKSPELTLPGQAEEVPPAYWGHDSTNVQEPLSESEATAAKRPRGRPRLPIPPEDEKRRRKQERDARYYQANRQQLLDSHNRWLEGNREHFNEYMRNYRKQGGNEYMRNYRKQRRNEYMRNYRKQRRKQSEAGFPQSEPEHPSEAIQIFPPNDKS